MQGEKIFLKPIQTTSITQFYLQTSVSFVLIKSQLFPLDVVLDQTSLKLPLCMYTNTLFPLFCRRLLTEKCLY